MPVTRADMQMVEWEATRYQDGRNYSDRDDLISDGMLGLTNAVKLWDSRREIRRRFPIREAFVKAVVKRSIIDGLRRRNGRSRDGRFPKQEFERRMYRFDRLMEDGEETLLDRFLGVDDEHVFVVTDLLRNLPERERDVVWRTVVEGDTLAIVAADLGVTESRVSQIRSRALARLRGEPMPPLPKSLPPIEPPSERELEVLRGMADGLNNAKIAARLFVAEETVKSHVRHLLTKLRAENRTHAVAIGFRHRLIA